MKCNITINGKNDRAAQTFCANKNIVVDLKPITLVFNELQTNKHFWNLTKPKIIGGRHVL